MSGWLAPIGEEEAATAVQALDGGVGVDLEAPHQDGAIHDELQRAELRRAVEDALDERGVIRAPTFGDIAVEARARLSGDDDSGVG